MEILSPEEIVESFKAALGSSFIDSKIYQREVAVKKNLFQAIWIYVKRDAFRQAVELIARLQEYPHLSIISSSDLGDRIGLIYHFTIYYGQHLKELSLGLCLSLPKNDLKIPTITDLIPGAIFTERETQEMMGVEVVGIPDDRRLFLPDDFPEGVYPWRKDETGPYDLLRVLPGHSCHSDSFASCHSEPFASCHSEGEKRPKNLAQDKLSEESHTAQDRLREETQDPWEKK